MSKQLNKQLRLIIGQAYETELERELDALEAEFRRWRSQEIDPFELEARIHRFHNGPARKLWSTYVEGPTSMLSFITNRFSMRVTAVRMWSLIGAPPRCRRTTASAGSRTPAPGDLT